MFKNTTIGGQKGNEFKNTTPGRQKGNKFKNTTPGRQKGSLCMNTTPGWRKGNVPVAGVVCIYFVLGVAKVEKPGGGQPAGTAACTSRFQP